MEKLQSLFYPLLDRSISRKLPEGPTVSKDEKTIAIEETGFQATKEFLEDLYPRLNLWSSRMQITNIAKAISRNSQRVLNGRPSLGVLCGEPGTGKTMIYELLNKTQSDKQLKENFLALFGPSLPLQDFKLIKIDITQAGVALGAEPTVGIGKEPGTYTYADWVKTLEESYPDTLVIMFIDEADKLMAHPLYKERLVRLLELSGGKIGDTHALGEKRIKIPPMIIFLAVNEIEKLYTPANPETWFNERTVRTDFVKAPLWDMLSSLIETLKKMKNTPSCNVFSKVLQAMYGSQSLSGRTLVDIFGDTSKAVERLVADDKSSDYFFGRMIQEMAKNNSPLPTPAFIVARDCLASPELSQTHLPFRQENPPTRLITRTIKNLGYQRFLEKLESDKTLRFEAIITGVSSGKKISVVVEDNAGASFSLLIDPRYKNSVKIGDQIVISPAICPGAKIIIGGTSIPLKKVGFSSPPKKEMSIPAYPGYYWRANGRNITLMHKVPIPEARRPYLAEKDRIIVSGEEKKEKDVSLIGGLNWDGSTVVVLNNDRRKALLIRPQKKFVLTTNTITINDHNYGLPAVFKKPIEEMQVMDDLIIIHTKEGDYIFRYLNNRFSALEARPYHRAVIDPRGQFIFIQKEKKSEVLVYPFILGKFDMTLPVYSFYPKRGWSLYPQLDGHLLIIEDGGTYHLLLVKS